MSVGKPSLNHDKEPAKKMDWMQSAVKSCFGSCEVSVEKGGGGSWVRLSFPRIYFDTLGFQNVNCPPTILTELVRETGDFSGGNLHRLCRIRIEF